MKMTVDVACLIIAGIGLVSTTLAMLVLVRFAGLFQRKKTGHTVESMANFTGDADNTEKVQD